MFDSGKVNKAIDNKTFGQERALYNLCNAVVTNCSFEGVEDGESAFKEARNIKVDNCKFSLRYPFWHTHDFEIINSKMGQTVRASLWYAKSGLLQNCDIVGVKCLRECENVTFSNCNVISSEFGWRCRDLTFKDCNMNSEYYLFQSSRVSIDNLKMSGKYSFQYTKDVTIENSILDTKDAFWHSENVTVKNCTVKGEYLGWYSKNLTLVNCKISGTQPFCYCEGLRLIDCEIADADLAFEYSDVDATMSGHIISVKNPKSGRIIADSIGEIILENSVMECTCEIVTKQ
jgi:hypothetical protein